MPDIILVSSPFISGNHPSLELSLLKSIFAENRIDSQIIYANLFFKRKVDEKYYEEICRMFSNNDIAEFIFAKYAFPGSIKKIDSYFKTLSEKNPVRTGKIASLCDKVTLFIDEMTERISGLSPRIVIIYAFMKQMCSSIALCRSLKATNSQIITTVFGNDFSREAGEELFKHTGSIDHILDGSPENSIVDFYHRVVSGQLKNKSIIKCEPVVNLNQLPYPDYSDYFCQLDELWYKHIKRSVCIESSRGCFYGQGNGCVFCGHGSGYNYIKKNPDMFIRELDFLITEYSPENIILNDFIMPPTFPEKVFMNYNKAGIKSIFYEISPKAGFKDLKILKLKGMNSCQAGIESLNDNILGILNKKTDTLNNIRFLRDCKINGIKPVWNFLFGIPGEEACDYDEMIFVVIPAIFHLFPPSDIRPLSLQKNSPLMNNPAFFGLTNIKPYDLYTNIFPDDVDTNKAAMFFTADYKTAFSDKTTKKKFFEAIQRWKNLWKKDPPSLKINNSSNEKSISDNRNNTLNPVKTIINEKHIEILRHSILPVDYDKMLKMTCHKSLSCELEELLERKILLKIGGRILSLVEFITEE